MVASLNTGVVRLHVTKAESDMQFLKNQGRNRNGFLGQPSCELLANNKHAG
jgi:hypothetical protein